MQREYDKHREEVRRMIEDEKLTQRRVAEILGVNRTTIERWCRRFGLKTQRTGPRSGAGHTNWKGGRKLVGDYWYVYTPDHPHATKQHCVAEHRLVMELKLGRYLLPQEVVHHIDGDPQHNAPENLMVFGSNAEHLKHELTGKVPKWTPEGRARILAAVRKQPYTRKS